MIEPSAGADRATLAFLCEAYNEDEAPDENGKPTKRVFLKLHPRLAPIKAAVFPLVRKDGMPEIAREIYKTLKPHLNVFYDEKSAVGRRYRRQDEVGTPFCITVDSQTLADGTVTIRDRDTLRTVARPQGRLSGRVDGAADGVIAAQLGSLSPCRVEKEKDPRDGKRGGHQIDHQQRRGGHRAGRPDVHLFPDAEHHAGDALGGFQAGETRSSPGRGRPKDGRGNRSFHRRRLSDELSADSLGDGVRSERGADGDQEPDAENPQERLALSNAIGDQRDGRQKLEDALQVAVAGEQDLV